MAKAKRSLASRVKKTVASPSVEAQEQALMKLQEKTSPKESEKVAKKEKVKKKKVRVSVDFPAEIYEVMKADTQRKGQTLKGFIVAMVREHYE